MHPHPLTVVEQGISFLIAWKRILRNSRKIGLSTRENGIWQITKKAISVFLIGSTKTLTARFAKPAAWRIVLVEEGVVLSAEASIAFLKASVFLGTLLPCFEILWTLRRCASLLLELAEEN
jgi:hypothetical protein